MFVYAVTVARSSPITNVPSPLISPLFEPAIALNEVPVPLIDNDELLLRFRVFALELAVSVKFVFANETVEASITFALTVPPEAATVFAPFNVSSSTVPV